MNSLVEIGESLVALGWVLIKCLFVGVLSLTMFLMFCILVYAVVFGAVRYVKEKRGKQSE